MKTFKKILIAILFLLLVNLISILIISVNLKTVLIDGVIKETIKEQIVRREEQNGNFVISEEIIAEISDDEKVQEILNSKEVQELMNKYLDLTVDGILDEEKLDEITIEKDILNYLKDNKETLSEIVGEEISVRRPKKLLVSNKFAEAIASKYHEDKKEETKTPTEFISAEVNNEIKENLENTITIPTFEELQARNKKVEEVIEAAKEEKVE